MRFTIEQQELSRALGAVERAAETKGAMPILATVQITALGDVATFACSDLTVTATAKAAITGGVGGAICVDAKKLADIAKALPKQSVEVDASAPGSLTVRAGKRKFTMPAMSGADYPELPKAPSSGGVEIVADTLRSLLERAAPSMSTDDTRPHLSCTLVEVGDGGVVHAVSTDGHRLTVAGPVSLGPIAPSLRVQIPAKACAEIAKLAARGNPVTLNVDSRNVYASACDIAIAAKLVEASFPAYEQVIPKDEPTTVATVKRAALLDAIRAVSLVNSDRTSGVRLRFGASGALTIDSENPDVGSGCDEVQIDLKGSPLTIGVNSRYLIDALNATSDGDVRFEGTGELDPMVTRASDVLVVTMPMRLDGGSR